MIFKKKDMIEIGELKKRGVVRIPKRDIVIPTNSEGFIDFRKKKVLTKRESTPQVNEDSNNEFFGFMDSQSQTDGNFSTQEEGYNKREVDERIVGLDNKIYKLEQRIELLERKLDISPTTGTDVGPMGW
jgi:hypothetical protein|tara:strand:+ start:249 stop:635 length:387 start_codon:yes stop_codon:yes gene_type:complete